MGCWCADGLACHAGTLALLANCPEARLWEEVLAAGTEEVWHRWAARQGPEAVPNTAR